MKVAFYKGRTRLFNRLVSWWLRGPYSHCELVLDTIDGYSHCVSSSFMDGGVRIKGIRLDPDHWDLVDVGGDKRKALAWLREHEEEGYDVLGLLGFAWRPEAGDTRKWFCSEATAAILGFDEPWRFDPMNLYAALNKKTL
jgi:hypothetical protein